LDPQARKEQLLELGVTMLRTQHLDDLSIDLLADVAGISRGLLYHYFTSKQDFRRAVIQRAVSDLFRLTDPPQEGDPVERLLASTAAYVDYVVDNRIGYVSLVQAVKGGDEELRAIYEQGRAGLLDRLFDEAALNDTAGVDFSDTPRTRLLVRGWSAMVEEVVLAWLDDPRGLTKEEIVTMTVTALAGVLAAS
jgi:AcrR family transcriptional regulator